jgi:hypothetical protein
MGGAGRHPRSRDDDSRAYPLTADPTRRAFELRFAKTVREIATTAQILALTADHLAHDAGEGAEVRAQRLRSRAETERREARRLWDLADELEQPTAPSTSGTPLRTR